MTATVWMQAMRRRMARRLERSRYLKGAPEYAQADLAPVCAALPDGNWRCERLLRTVSDVRVYIMRAEHGETCVLKVASTVSSASGLRRERSVLTQLGSDRQLGDWSAVVPVLLAAGEAGASLTSSPASCRAGMAGSGRRRRWPV